MVIVAAGLGAAGGSGFFFLAKAAVVLLANKQMSNVMGKLRVMSFKAWQISYLNAHFKAFSIKFHSLRILMCTKIISIEISIYAFRFLTYLCMVKLKTNIILSLLLASVASFVFIKSMRKPMDIKIPALKTLDSQAYDMKSLKGKVCVVSYFQTWCGDCVKEQPELQKLQNRFGDSLTILMVSDEPIPKIKAFKERFQSNLNFYHSGAKLKTDLGVSAYPTTILIDKKGKEKLKRVEGIEWYNAETIQAVSDCLK
jgi:thiol-disulfide isomerase/thioredoxin